MQSLSNPYDSPPPTELKPKPTKRIRWRIIPVSFFSLLTLLNLSLAIFNFSVFACLQLPDRVPEGWSQQEVFRYLLNGCLSLFQSTFLGLARSGFGGNAIG